VSAEILINARFLSQAVTGVQRYAVELVRAFDRLIDCGAIDHDFVLIGPKTVKETLSLKHIPLRRVGSLTGHAWEQLELPLHTRGRLLLSLCNAAPIAKSRQIVTIHDAAVFAAPEAYSLSFRLWYRVMLRQLGKRAARIVTVSGFSSSELGRHCSIDEERIAVIHSGHEHVFCESANAGILSKHGLDGKPYLLAVSSLSPNKNFRAIVEALAYLDDGDSSGNFEVVIAGGANPKVFSQHAVLPDRVKHLGYVSDGELRALYEGAVGFVYPSLYEGFGFPPLEAMACGCPVIASRAASLPEICGDAALYCDPRRPKDIAAKMKELVGNPELQENLKRKGLEQVKGFSWDACARNTVAIIDSVLEEF
jgi:glycosyltransferase involved in cell wall biosynthesis